jgi:glycolate oxidase FAD binding subunit
LKSPSIEARCERRDVTDATLSRFADAVRDAAQAQRPLRLRGGGSKDFYGQLVQGDIVDTRSYAGIVEYDPTELVVTARCGTPLADIETALAQKQQMLACECPHFGAGSTLGGAVAAGLSGPRRQAAGSVRDFVLGAKLMDGRGEVLNFGGRVMKNVAGYDVSRLLAGSLGTLGIILEVSLKTLPLPVASATLSFELPEDRAIRALNQWGGKPLPVSASAWTGGELRVRLCGAAAAVRAACESMGGERIADDAALAYWRAVRDQSDMFFTEGDAPFASLWRLSLPSIVAPLQLSGELLIEWGGGLRWLKSGADAALIRDAAARAGGHATLFRAADEVKAAAGVFQPLPATMLRIHRGLKAQFDPAGIFNRGRMYAEF